MSMLNILLFKGTKLIRFDDLYVPEVKVKEKTTYYWITTDVKKIVMATQLLLSM